MPFQPAKTDLDFARRSARYLAECHCTEGQIREALIEELDVSAPVAEAIVETIAA